MLLLKRRVGQAIVIGGRIRIFINRVEGRYVTLAIEAPTEKRILREELVGRRRVAKPKPYDPGAEWDKLAMEMGETSEIFKHMTEGKTRREWIKANRPLSPYELSLRRHPDTD